MGDLFSDAKNRATQFAESIWLCQLVSETIENLVEFQKKYDDALLTNDPKQIEQAKLQVDATIASLQLASYLDGGSGGD